MAWLPAGEVTIRLDALETERRSIVPRACGLCEMRVRAKVVRAGQKSKPTRRCRRHALNAGGYGCTRTTPFLPFDLFPLQLIHDFPRLACQVSAVESLDIQDVAYTFWPSKRSSSAVSEVKTFGSRCVRMSDLHGTLTELYEWQGPSPR